MFFSRIYKSWEEIQREKYEKLFNTLDFLDMKGKKILDIGSGCFYLEKFLLEHGLEADIVALDIDKGIVNKDRNVAFIIADGKELPFRDSVFDFVISIDAMHLIKRDDFHRVLKKNGLVLLSVFFNKENYEEKKSSLKERVKPLDIINEFEIRGRENEYFVLAKKITSFPVP